MRSVYEERVFKGLYQSSLEKTPKPCDQRPNEDGTLLTEHLIMISQHNLTET